MTAPAIRQQRLAQQRLTHNRVQTPAEVVSWLGAVQSQDYGGALWSLGMRMQAPTEAAVEQAFAEGAILRTHLMRPTWHFVAPADIRWLLTLTAPRVKAQLAYNDRRWGINEALIRRCNTLIASALQGQQHRTRSELGAVLAEAGIDVEGYRLGQLMIHAELDGVVCSGPRRGKQFTYALLEERVPPAPPLGREEALAELTRRYFTGHGPATVQDFVWWSGLTVADAKAGLAAVGTELDQSVVDGQTFWFAASPLPAAEADVALLLPTFDEFLVGYASFDAERRGGRDAGRQLVFESTVVIGGQVVGSWRRTLKKQALVEIAPFESLPAVQQAAVVAAAQRYGAFVGLPAQSTVISAEESASSIPE